MTTQSRKGPVNCSNRSDYIRTSPQTQRATRTVTTVIILADKPSLYWTFRTSAVWSVRGLLYRYHGTLWRFGSCSSWRPNGKCFLSGRFRNKVLSRCWETPFFRGGNGGKMDQKKPLLEVRGLNRQAKWRGQHCDTETLFVQRKWYVTGRWDRFWKKFSQKLMDTLIIIKTGGFTPSWMTNEISVIIRQFNYIWTITVRDALRHLEDSPSLCQDFYSNVER